MPDLVPNDRLRLAREAMSSRRYPGTPMGRTELAALVAQWIERHDEKGRSHPFDAVHLGKIERGVVKRPGPIIRAALCAVLDASECDLGFLRPPDADRVAQAASGRLATDSAAIDAVAQVLASVRRLEDAAGAAEVLPTVRAQAALATQLADNARGNVRPKAVGLLSELEQYQGWLNIPLQRWDESRRYLDRASVLALEADDPTRLSTALSFAAYRNLRRNDLRSADALNEAAARDDRVNIGLRTYVTFQRAEVLARDGSRTEALARLREADRLSEHLPPADELPDSGYWYVPSFFHGQRAFVLHALGDHSGAARLAREAIAMMPESWRDAEWAGRRRALAELES
ncbi:XRE family transcriptional regulator [Amycolatopsis sp. NPDC051128]|uniref:XRE family transcriptional regulator n=1 Tax=Amycolatopsis sp. NPDC051128 TaxID=3155412 RepID=UPI003441B77E